MIRRPPRSTLFPTRRSSDLHCEVGRNKEEDAFHVFGLRVDNKLAAKWGRSSGISSVRGRDQARDCIPSVSRGVVPEKQKGGRSRLSGLARPVGAAAASALGFGL